MRFLYGYGHPLWCAFPMGWTCPRYSLPRLDVLRIACPGGSPAAARWCASVIGPAAAHGALLAGSPFPGAYGTLLADRLAGSRIGALRSGPPHACARSALQKTILENSTIFTTWQIRSQKRPFFKLSEYSDILTRCRYCIHNSAIFSCV